LPLFQRIVPMMIAKTMAKIKPIRITGLTGLESAAGAIIAPLARFVKSVGR
jgi:hypothetical protein